MGKSKKDYREEVEYHTVYDSGPSSEDDDASSSSSNSPSSSSSGSRDSSNSNQERHQRRHVKRKSSKAKREKKSKRGNSSEDEDEEEQQKRKRARHTVEEHPDEWRHHGSTGGRRKKHHHHHHHRKHKHKHRRHRRHHSEERGSRGGGDGGRSLERPVDGRKGRDAEERRGRERLEPERERRPPRDMERRNRKEEKRSREKGRTDARPVKSKWEDEDDSLSSDVNRRIKIEPGLEREGREGSEEWNGEYEESNGRGRKQKHQQQQRRRQEHQEENVHPPQRVKEEQGSRSPWDNSNSTAASENGRTGWGQAGGGGGEGDGGGGGNGGGGGGDKDAEGEEERQKPNLAVTGKLAEDTNMYNGVVIKYSQPSEARKPKRRWRWYIFKGDEELPFLPLHRQSAYLIGRDRKVADIPTDHPSCSKQHAVLQYRLVTYNREDGTKGRTVKPYILDLGSANGTYVNNRRIDSKRFVELLEKDVVKFGYSSREYILLHEGSKGDDEDMPDTGTDLSPVSLLRT